MLSIFFSSVCCGSFFWILYCFFTKPTAPKKIPLSAQFYIISIDSPHNKAKSRDLTIMNTSQQRFYGFDYARAIFCIAIVAWHFKLIGNVSKADNYQGFQYIDIINFHFFLLAVPFFVQLSLFLYSRGRLKKTGYFKKRFFHLCNLFTLWVSFAVMIRYVRGEDISQYFETPMSFLTMIYHGGYNIYYFIFIVIITTIIIEFTYKLMNYIPVKNQKNILLLFFSISLTPILLQPFFNWNFRNPINFLPLVFSSILVNENKEFQSNKAILIYGILYVVFSISDWFLIPYYNLFEQEGLLMPDYSRISLIFGSIFLLTSFSKITRPPSKIIQVLSSYSLGIYCLHIAVPKMTITLTQQLVGDRYTPLFTVAPDTTNILPFLLSVLTTVPVVCLIKKVPFFSKYV